MRVRKAVSMEKAPAEPDPTLLWFSRAIGIMRTKRKFVDPTSWRFQAAVHDYGAEIDPYFDVTDLAPRARVLDKYCRQCQHSSWFFLPWHRMYLYHFEHIVAKAVVEAGGPPEWTLPYWDYSASDEARKLPWAFGQPTWPGGETNYLCVPQRADGLNEGTTSLDKADVDTATALGMQYFSSSATSSDIQFGGPNVKNHGGGAYPFGGLETSPHNNIHVAVGGRTGFLRDPRLAALDPIFWLHHCNLDRLWEVWIRQEGRANPTESAWLEGVAFPFHDANKKSVRMTPSQVLDTARLGYGYDGLPPLASIGKPAKSARPGRRRPSMVGATSSSFSLSNDPHHITIPTPPLAAASTSPSPDPDHERVLLHVENLTSEQRAGAYDVYVNVPAGASQTSFPARRAGRISLFGARGPKRRAGGHDRDGLSFVLDVTDIYRQLSASGEWDPARLGVTFKPVYDWNDPVNVGRVSVNVS